MNDPVVRVRRVGFRDGTDAELAALHGITTRVEAERGTDQYPKPLHSYVAFARSLPSQFDDHAWLAETVDGSPVAVGFCWSNRAGDPKTMECDILVGRDTRRQGIGSRLFAMICDETANEGRSLLTWSTFEAVPAGDAFCRHHGARVGRINRSSEVMLADIDWLTVEDWMLAPRARKLGYRIEFVDGVFPASLRTDAATLHHIMQTAPRDDLDVGELIVDADFIAELDRQLIETGRTRWTAFVRDSHGACVGGTEVTFDPWEPTLALQQNTGIDPAHRRRGLAKWAKASMLERIRNERPDVELVRTGNTFSNTAMLAINDQLGFTTTSVRTEWQLNVDRRLPRT